MRDLPPIVDGKGISVRSRAGAANEAAGCGAGRWGCGFRSGADCSTSGSLAALPEITTGVPVTAGGGIVAGAATSGRAAAVIPGIMAGVSGTTGRGILAGTAASGGAALV